MVMTHSVLAVCYSPDFTANMVMVHTALQLFSHAPRVVLEVVVVVV